MGGPGGFVTGCTVIFGRIMQQIPSQQVFVTVLAIIPLPILHPCFSSGGSAEGQEE
jgi:hypothetical protein